MKNKKFWIIILSILLSLFLGAFLFWYFTQYKCTYNPNGFEFLNRFVTKNTCEEKQYSLKGTIFNTRVEDQNIIFDLNAWDLKNKKSLYFNNLSFPINKYANEFQINEGDIKAYTLNFSYEKDDSNFLTSFFGKNEYSLKSWSVEEIQIEKEEVSKLLKETYTALVNLNETEAETRNEILYKNYIISLYFKNKLDYVDEKDINFKVELQKETEKEERDIPVYSLENILYLEPNNCSIMLGIVENNNVDVNENLSKVQSVGCSNESLNVIANSKASGNKNIPFEYKDLLSLISIENLNKNLNNQLEKDEVVNLINLINDLKISSRIGNISYSENIELLNLISSDIISGGLFDYEVFCSLATTREDYDFYQSSAILFDKNNINNMFEITDKYFNISLLCTKAFLNSNNKVLEQWAKANFYKAYYMNYKDNPSEYITKDPIYTSEFINLLLNNYAKSL